MTTSTEVHIAGVPWPAYKVIALAVGALVFVIVGVMTASAAPAVLSGAAAAVVVWLGRAVVRSSDATLDESAQFRQVGGHRGRIGVERLVSDI